MAAYARRLAPEADRRGVALGEPVGGDDEWAAKVELLAAERVPVVSFAFGLPPAGAVAALHRAGAAVLVTVTTADEAVAAAGAGADALVVQGAEAGAHRGGPTDPDRDELGLLPLLRLVGRVTPLPLVAAGGIADGAAVAAVLAAGAALAQLGTAFLRCPEAGTAALHRTALAAPGDTVLTRAFTGRRARGAGHPVRHRALGGRAGGVPARPPADGAAARRRPGRRRPGRGQPVGRPGARARPRAAGRRAGGPARRRRPGRADHRAQRFPGVSRPRSNASATAAARSLTPSLA